MVSEKCSPLLLAHVLLDDTSRVRPYPASAWGKSFIDGPNANSNRGAAQANRRFSKAVVADVELEICREVALAATDLRQNNHLLRRWVE
jgi:hypothetical protein